MGPVGNHRFCADLTKEKERDDMDINQMNEVTIPNTERKSEKGVTTVEYAVMLVLVAIAVLAFGSGIANSVTGVFSNLAASLG
jgi:Flp pilus assembly pilin Flp